MSYFGASSTRVPSPIITSFSGSMNWTMLPVVSVNIPRLWPATFAWECCHLLGKVTCCWELTWYLPTSLFFCVHADDVTLVNKTVTMYPSMLSHTPSFSLLYHCSSCLSEHSYAVCIMSLTFASFSVCVCVCVSANVCWCIWSIADFRPGYTSESFVRVVPCNETYLPNIL